MRAGRWLLLVAWVVLGELAQGAAAQAPRFEAPEASVKAAFLYKFTAYVEWPASAFPSAAAPFVFGIAGHDDVATELERVTAGRQVNGHPIVVKRVDADHVRGLHVLFIGRAAAERFAAVIQAAQLPGVLVVTENDKGPTGVSAINFVVRDDRVGFEVAPEAAERNGVRISSRMLAVAKRVVQR